MRQFKSKMIRSAMRREASHRIETRDAILWDVFPDDRYCRVKIQGSNTLIRAYYPENIEQKPMWLKPGNSVRIQHTGGNRNRIEIVGHGQYIPTPTEAATFPTQALGADAVLTGCKVKALADPAMEVYITTGTYRISDVIYTLDPATMSATSDITMGSGLLMGDAYTTVSVDAADSSLFRLDLFAVGSDGVVDYIKGTASSAPTLPDVPANHVMLAFVLVPPGTTEISDALIGTTYAAPFVSTISVSASETELGYTGVDPDWVAETTSVLTVSVLDQYNNIMSGQNWYVKAEFLSGDGLIDGNAVDKTKSTGSDAVCTFTYTRDDPDNNVSPMIKVSLLEDPDIYSITFIQLSDTDGNPIME